ncbi:ankyrin repeat domain-containing protein [Pontiellaceae bacterium B12219]|nr:ankyrin repeat domain-containing protein [Pontiellaceae bacterium B12219]
MADIYIIKERLRFSLLAALSAMGLSALAAWHFWNQIEIEADRSRFLLAASITAALGVAVIGLFLFYLLAKREVNPAFSFADRLDRIPWWIINVVIIVGIIGGAGFFIARNSDHAQNEFDLIRFNHLTALELRIDENPAVLGKKDAKSGRTLLQVAFVENYPDAVKMLIDAGASVEELAVESGNPVIASLENLPMLGTLMDCGLNPELPDGEGIPPIHYAVAMNSVEAVEILLNSQAKVDARDRLFRTPLMRAIEEDNLPMAGNLINFGSDVNAFDQRGDTALHLAVRRRNPEMVRLLLKHGSDPTIFNFTHFTPLHIAASAGQDELVELFMDDASLVGLYDDGDRTPFDMAIQSRAYETATLLLENGADLNRRLSGGDTLMHLAVESKDYRTARFLIRAGADVSIPDSSGRTALDLIRNKQLQGLEELVAERELPAEISE